MVERQIAAVILGAGLGKRMRSELPKVLHPVLGEAMIDHVLRAVQGAGVQRIYMVTGHKGELVEAHVRGRAQCIDQPERLGTGHAVQMTAEALGDFEGDVVVTYGDMPLIRTETYQKLIEHQRQNGTAAVMLTAHLHPPTGYGRIVRNAQGGFQEIVEEKDCSAAQKEITEINTGLYIFDSHLLFAALKRVGNKNAQGEYYLTDVPAILLGDGHKIDIMVTQDEVEVLGVNSREQLADVSGRLRTRVLQGWMEQGITISDAATTFIESTVQLGHDCVIEPCSVLRGRTVVGPRAVVGPHCELIDANIGADARVRQSVVENGAVAAGAAVGPFAYIK